MAMAIDCISNVLQQQWQRRRNRATTTTAAIDRSQLQWDWGRGTGALETGTGATGQWLQWQWRSIVFLSKRNVYVLFRGSMSSIVVVENVQNVWTAIIREVVPANKTCMICSKIVFGVSYLYSKVELVNAFQINSSLKWSKLYSNCVSNIISECSYFSEAVPSVKNHMKVWY
jgi:hypothetical protein